MEKVVKFKYPGQRIFTFASVIRKAHKGYFVRLSAQKSRYVPASELEFVGGA